MEHLQNGGVEVLDQLIEFLSDLSAEQFTASAAPVFESTIGQHVRHICDMYQALMKCSTSHTINYNHRRRGATLETNLIHAVDELLMIKQWVGDLSRENLCESLTVITEVSIKDEQSSEVISNVARELSFSSSHLTHHLALMAAIARSLGCDVDNTIGMAPATVTNLRQALEPDNQDSVDTCAP